MTILEAVVWCFGIMVAGITICSVAGSFSRAVRTVKLTQEETRKGTRNDSEDDVEGGGEIPRR